MAMTDRRWESWAPSSALQDQTQIRKLLKGIFGLHASYTAEFWLWRGQARASLPVTSGIHTRILNEKSSKVSSLEIATGLATKQLLSRARQAGLDRIGDFRMTDMALLAHLQHHGAATPLLDVSVDPLLATWMAVHPGASGSDDGEDGIVFAIKRPATDAEANAYNRLHPDAVPMDSREIHPLDSRDFTARPLGAKSIQAHVAGIGGCFWFRPPDVSERLRIQRGSFLLSAFLESAVGADGKVPATSLDLKATASSPWLQHRMERLGKAGQPRKASSDIVAFRIRKELKPAIRDWLSDRSGLTEKVVYPVPWRRPFLEQFCEAHNRSAPVEL